MCLSLYSLNNCLLFFLLLPRYTYRSIIYHSVYLYCTLLCSPIPVFAISHFCLNNVEYSVRLLSVISYIHTFCHLSCTRCCSCCSYHTGCFSFVLPSPWTRGWLCLGKLSPHRHEWWFCCICGTEKSTFNLSATTVLPALPTFVCECVLRTCKYTR